jgi:hypothetical protein
MVLLSILATLAAVSILILVTLPTVPVHGAAPASPLGLPGGSTISGTLATNDTWGPGTITVTGDILISPGVIITVSPGTTVQMATHDGANLGIDANRIEYIVRGTLRASGPVTFTSQSDTPAGGTGTASAFDWAPAAGWFGPPSSTT